MLYVGEGVTITAAATDPLRNLAITDATAEVTFFAPGRNPKSDPEDRTPDFGPEPLVYDADLQMYVGYVETDSGWAAGRWTYKVTMTGQYSAWEYGTFTLKA